MVWTMAWVASGAILGLTCREGFEVERVMRGRMAGAKKTSGIGLDDR
jgi:hypothetical protein